MEIIVHRAGLLTTVQDAGRGGHRAAGIPLSGAMDPFALRLANLLVGNPERTAALEFTLLGAELEFSAAVTVAFGGGDFGGLPRWQPVQIAAGTRLKFGAAREGCRGYLAVGGGVDVPPVLGSCSTYLRAGFGGHHGRALRDGDVLAVREIPRAFAGNWRLDGRVLPAYGPAPEVRAVRGAQAEEFGTSFWESTFTVTSKSDRMGVRLAGPPIVRSTGVDLISRTAVPGTVQIPPDGQPIVLMADAQTIGGYPQVAHVASVDLPLVAQLRPGDTLRFRDVPLAEAHERLRARERLMGLLREGLAQKIT